MEKITVDPAWWAAHQVKLERIDVKLSAAIVILDQARLTKTTTLHGAVQLALDQSREALELLRQAQTPF